MAKVVILGDSNEAVFGPVISEWLQTTGLARADIKFHAKGSSFAEWAPGKTLWKKVSDALGEDTRLVVIGLGGNMLTRSKVHHQIIRKLVEGVVARAPHARLVWRGPPPATATKGRTIAGPKAKAFRYLKNKILKDVLTAMDFAVLDASLPKVEAKRRVYIDVIDLHAGGPAPGRAGVAAGKLGTPECLAYERKAIAAFKALAGQVPSVGPWDTYTRSRDGMTVHVPLEVARDLVTRHLVKLGAFAF